MWLNSTSKISASIAYHTYVLAGYYVNDNSSCLNVIMTDGRKQVLHMPCINGIISGNYINADKYQQSCRHF